MCDLNDGSVPEWLLVPSHNPLISTYCVIIVYLFCTPFEARPEVIFYKVTFPGHFTVVRL